MRPHFFVVKCNNNRGSGYPSNFQLNQGIVRNGNVVEDEAVHYGFSHHFQGNRTKQVQNDIATTIFNGNF